jgi:hypothetical protein
MIDELALSPQVHVVVGTLVLVATLAAALVSGWQLWRAGRLSGAMPGLLIATQLVLMIQALLGIKLLDQGLGVLQLYIHYVGGLAPLFFLVLLYWLPLRNPRTRARATFGAATAAFIFALLAFTIGQSYVNNPPGL